MVLDSLAKSAAQTGSFLDVSEDRRSVTERLVGWSAKHGPQRSYSNDNSSPSFHRMSSSSSIKSHSKRPSLTNWLNRNGSSKSANKNPQLLRPSVLGTGATIVGTPQEALNRVPGVHLEPYAEEDDSMMSLDEYELGRKPTLAAVKCDEAELPSPPESPERTLPSLPEFTQSQPNLLTSISSSPSKRPYPSRTPPSPPTLKPSSKNFFTKGSWQPRDYDRQPVMPARLTVPPPSSQPPFSAILLSPAAPIDRSKVIIHIETESQVFRTTIGTITSRPSHLALYVEQVLSMSPVTPSARSGDDTSVYSEDASAFHKFLASEGVLSTSSCNLKLFLDRPSSPYKHILAYLRMLNDGSLPPVLPRSARLAFEAGVGISVLELLELRDEALYLGLQELCALCTEELRLHLSEQSKKCARGTSEGSRHSDSSTVDRGESERDQMATPQSMDSQTSKRRSRSLTRPSLHSLQSRDSPASNNTIKRPSHSRKESQVSARWI